MGLVGKIYTDRKMVSEKMVRDDELLVLECSLLARGPRILVTPSASLSRYAREEPR